MEGDSSWHLAWVASALVSCLVPLAMTVLDSTVFDKDQGNKYLKVLSDNYFLVSIGYIVFSAVFIPVAIALGVPALITNVSYFATGTILGGAMGMILAKLERKYKRT